MSTSGLRISPEHPFLGASPDFLFDCPCTKCAPFQGKGVGEIKCPWSHKSHTVRHAALTDPQFALFIHSDSHELELKRNHSYFYQVQVQMGVTKRLLALFVCYTQIDVAFATVPFDPDFFNNLVSPSRSFFVRAVLPEIVANHFTKKTLTSVNEIQPGVYMPCFCKKQLDDSVQLLRCSNEDCAIKSYHIPCILTMLSRKTLPKIFTCKDCKKLHSRKVKKMPYGEK